MFTKNFYIGALTGLGTASLGFYLYQRNKNGIDDFLRRQGIAMPAQGMDFSRMGMEELMATKEKIEDLIAEMEYAEKQAGKSEEKG